MITRTEDGATVMDITKSYIPLMVVAVVLAVVFQLGQIYKDITTTPNTLGAQLTEFKAAYALDQASLRNDISDLSRSIETLRTSFLDPARGVPTDVIRRSELYVFCLEIERGNTGVKCPLKSSKE